MLHNFLFLLLDANFAFGAFAYRSFEHGGFTFGTFAHRSFAHGGFARLCAHRRR
jgi:hypothetical protein